MQRNKFLPEILVTLFDRHRGTRTDDDPRDIYELCNALIAQEGQVSGDQNRRSHSCAVSCFQ